MQITTNSTYEEPTGISKLDLRKIEETSIGGRRNQYLQNISHIKVPTKMRNHQYTNTSINTKSNHTNINILEGIQIMRAVKSVSYLTTSSVAKSKPLQADSPR